MLLSLMCFSSERTNGLRTKPSRASFGPAQEMKDRLAVPKILRRFSRRFRRGLTPGTPADREIPSTFCDSSISITPNHFRGAEIPLTPVQDNIAAGKSKSRVKRRSRVGGLGKRRRKGEKGREREWERGDATDAGGDSGGAAARRAGF